MRCLSSSPRAPWSLLLLAHTRAITREDVAAAVHLHLEASTSTRRTSKRRR